MSEGAAACVTTRAWSAATSPLVTRRPMLGGQSMSTRSNPSTPASALRSRNSLPRDTSASRSARARLAGMHDTPSPHAVLVIASAATPLASAKSTSPVVNSPPSTPRPTVAFAWGSRSMMRMRQEGSGAAAEAIQAQCPSCQPHPSGSLQRRSSCVHGYTWTCLQRTRHAETVCDLVTWAFLLECSPRRVGHACPLVYLSTRRPLATDPRESGNVGLHSPAARFALCSHNMASHRLRHSVTWPALVGSPSGSPELRGVSELRLSGCDLLGRVGDTSLITAL